MKKLYCMLALSFATLTFAADDVPKPDPWAPVRPLVGEWTGAAEGEPGKGTVARSYTFVLGGKFIEERTVSTCPAQE